MSRLVVSYKFPSDPPPKELEAVEQLLAGLRVVDRMPGTLLVEGTLSDVRSRLATTKPNWSATPVQQLRSPSPHRAKKLKG
jgi:hypothetical protein